MTQDGAPLEWQAGINGFFIADQDIDLYAVWIDAVEIKFYCTEGKPIDDAQGPDGDWLIDEFGDAYYRRIVEKGYWLEGRGGGDMTPPPGKMLAGWSLTRGGEPLEWRDDIVGILVVNENTNLYAVWGDPVEIRLNCTEGKHTDGYEDSDGNWIRKETSEPCISRIVLKGSSFSEGGGDMIPPVGKVFAGWSLTPDGEPLEWQDDIPGYFIANDSIDLYAKWTAAVEMTFVAVNNTFDKDKQDREGFIPLNDSYTVVKKYYDVKGVFDWCAFPEDYEKHFVGKDEDTTFLGWYRDSSGKSRLEYDDSIGGFFRFTNDDLQNGITLYGIWQRDDFAIKSNNNDEISVWVDRDKLEPVITAAYSNAVNQALQDASVVNVQTEVYLDSRRTINQDKTIDFHITPYIQLMAFDAGNNKSPIGNQMILSNSLINGITFYINLVLPAADYPVGIPVKVEHKDNNGNLKNTFYCVARALSKDDNGNVTETSVTVVTDSFSVFTASVATYRDVPVTLGTDVKSVTVTADGISKIVNKTDTIKSFHLPVDAVITITATVENGYTAVINPAGPVRVDKIPAAGITVNAKKKESYVPSLYYLTLASSDGAKTKPSCSKDITTGYSSGTQMTVTASEPNDGYVFDGWYEGNTKKSDSRTYSFKLNNNTTLTAKYKKVVTIVADNDSVAVGEKVKLGKTSILGLNNSDVNSIVDISGLTLTCSYTEKAQVGDTFAIIPSGAVLKDNQYVLEYRDGLLTVIRGQAVDTFLANDLPAVENVRIADREKVEKGKADYAKLSDTQKSLPEVVSAKEKLDTVEKALKAAEEKATSDQDAANAVIQLIKALPEKPTIEDKEKVKTAENAYEKLSNDQKAYISEADKGKLVSAVKVIDEAEKEKAADDKVKADVVKKLIDQLPDVAVPEKSVAVNAVYKQYIALTNGQKALIPKAEKEKLEALRKALDGKDQDAAGETVVEKFTEAVNAVPGSKAGTGKGLLDEATAIYTTMTEAQKALVSSETMSLYYEAGTAFKKDRKFKSGDAYYKVLSNGDVTYLKPASKEITKVTVPNQVKKGKFLFKVIKVSSNAFRNCNNLGWAVIGKNVRVFGEYVFARTYNLSKVKVLGTGFKSGKITNAFVKAGKNGRLIVKVPGSKVNEYQKLFTGEGRLKGSVTAA